MLNFAKHVLAIVAASIVGYVVYPLSVLVLSAAAFLIASIFMHVSDHIGFFMLGFACAVSFPVQWKAMDYVHNSLADRIFLF